MADELNEILKTEKARAAVNLLFIASLLIPYRGIIFIAFIAWIFYLVYCIRRTSSKVVKIINGIFIVFASSIIVVCLYLMLKYAG